MPGLPSVTRGYREGSLIRERSWLDCRTCSPRAKSGARRVPPTDDLLRSAKHHNKQRWMEHGQTKAKNICESTYRQFDRNSQQERALSLLLEKAFMDRSNGLIFMA